MSVSPQPAYEGREPYVFVSYSHEDQEDVYTEIAGLQYQGVNVWYDVSGIDAVKPRIFGPLVKLGISGSPLVPGIGRWPNPRQIGPATARPATRADGSCCTLPATD